MESRLCNPFKCLTWEYRLTNPWKTNIELAM